MEVGSQLGYLLASLDNKFWLLLVSFLLGFVTILAEPSVHVLTHQIEEVTSGYVKRKAVAASLSIGVGSAILLSAIGSWCPGLLCAHSAAGLSHCDCNDLLFTQPLRGNRLRCRQCCYRTFDHYFYPAFTRVRQVPFPARIFSVTGWG